MGAAVAVAARGSSLCRIHLAEIALQADPRPAQVMGHVQMPTVLALSITERGCGAWVQVQKTPCRSLTGERSVLPVRCLVHLQKTLYIYTKRCVQYDWHTSSSRRRSKAVERER